MQGWRKIIQLVLTLFAMINSTYTLSKYIGLLLLVGIICYGYSFTKKDAIRQQENFIKNHPT